ncbi:MAG TPA: ABC transporter permease [Acetobacteraceae bacterium]
MAAYLGRRILQSLLILVGISIVTFVLLYMLPADPAAQVAGRSASPAMIANVRHELGLDQPIYKQYFRYAGGLLQGNLGRSYLERTEVTTLIASRFPATLQLMIGGVICELALGLTIGIIAALRRDSRVDQILMVTMFVTVSSPQFVLGIILLYVFAFELGWFPIGGYGGLRHLVLPSLTLGILGAGWYGRMMRSSMLDVLRQDYIRTARAKGLSRITIVLGHALPNAVLPIIAMIGIDIGNFMGGFVVVESVFGWPGIGNLTWLAIQRIDIPIIMGVTVISACAIVIGNLLADIIVPAIDPRIKLK